MRAVNRQSGRRSSLQIFWLERPDDTKKWLKKETLPGKWKLQNDHTDKGLRDSVQLTRQDPIHENQEEIIDPRKLQLDDTDKELRESVKLMLRYPGGKSSEAETLREHYLLLANKEQLKVST